MNQVGLGLPVGEGV